MKSYELRTTGKAIEFLKVAIGNPFAAHGRIWIRTSYEAATELAYSGYHAARTCNFTDEEEDRVVEMVNVIIDGKEEGDKHGITLNPDLLATVPDLCGTGRLYRSNFNMK